MPAPGLLLPVNQSDIFRIFKGALFYGDPLRQAHLQILTEAESTIENHRHGRRNFHAFQRSALAEHIGAQHGNTVRDHHSFQISHPIESVMVNGFHAAGNDYAFHIDNLKLYGILNL